MRGFDTVLNHKSKPQLLEDPDKSLSLILQHDRVLTGLSFFFFSPACWLLSAASFLPPVPDCFGPLQVCCRVPGAGWLGGWPAEGDRLHGIGGKRGIMLPDTCGEALPACRSPHLCGQLHSSALRTEVFQSYPLPSVEVTW